ncbi:MAG: ParA family protein [Limnochordaceae bacterium]|nr:ParA family protein [Limnochordaceae bacterium]
MGRLLAVANQKGGVGKTTTVLHLAAALATFGYKVLAVDLDPQASLTLWSGFEPDDLEPTVYQGLVGPARVRMSLAEAEAAASCEDGNDRTAGREDGARHDGGEEIPADEIILRTRLGYDLLPANADLALAEMDLVNLMARERRLGLLLTPVRSQYDFILIDCQPSLGLLTVNALAASDELLVPVSCEFLAWRALRVLFRLAGRIRLELNSQLKLTGVIPTMLDTRTRHSREILETLETRLAQVIPVLEPPVHRSIRFSDASQARRSVFEIAPDVPGAAAYQQLAQAVAAAKPARMRAWREILAAIR